MWIYGSWIQALFDCNQVLEEKLDTANKKLEQIEKNAPDLMDIKVGTNIHFIMFLTVFLCIYAHKQKYIYR